MAAVRWMLRWVVAAAAAVAAALALDNGLARTPPMGWLHWERFLCATDCAADPRSCIRYRPGQRRERRAGPVLSTRCAFPALPRVCGGDRHQTFSAFLPGRAPCPCPASSCSWRWLTEWLRTAGGTLATSSSALMTAGWPRRGTSRAGCRPTQNGSPVASAGWPTT